MKVAIFAYSAYRAFNNARVEGSLAPEETFRMLVQYAKEAVRGHCFATEALDIWCPLYAGTNPPERSRTGQRRNRNTSDVFEREVRPRTTPQAGSAQRRGQ